MKLTARQPPVIAAPGILLAVDVDDFLKVLHSLAFRFCSEIDEVLCQIGRTAEKPGDIDFRIACCHKISFHCSTSRSLPNAIVCGIGVSLPSMTQRSTVLSRHLAGPLGSHDRSICADR